MTVQEMMIEVHDQLGRPTDIYPYNADGETIDIANGGAVRLLQWLNRGYRRILTWRGVRRKGINFRCMEREAFFTMPIVTGTATAGTTNTITLPIAVSNIADRYTGWVVEITGGTGAGQERIITAYSDLRVATVGVDWYTTPDATSTFRLSKNFMDFVGAASPIADDNIVLDPEDGIISVLMVEDLKNKSRLARAERTQSFETMMNGSGAPSVYRDAGSGLQFDTAVKTARGFKLTYYGYPPEMTALADEPAVPAQFHEAIVLWATWWGLRRYQEYSGAYSTKRDLIDTMETAIQQFDKSTGREKMSLRMGDYNGSY